MIPDNTRVLPNQTAARVYGVFFLLAFLSYGSGSAIVATYADGAQGLAGVFAHKSLYVAGFILMAVVHSVVNIGLAVIMLPILKPFAKTAAYGYFAAAVAATVVAIVGALFLVLLVPLSAAFAAQNSDAAYFQTMAMVLKKGGFYAYQLGMTLWGLGGLMLCYALYIARLVPRFLPVWGVFGYLVFIVGTMSEMFGYGIGVMLSAPGGLFEITLSVWLIFKGFNAASSNAQGRVLPISMQTTGI